MEGKCKAIKYGESGQLIERNTEAKLWAKAITCAWLLPPLLMAAGLWVWMASGHVNRACFERRMNDEHTLMEAFFPNPPAQDAAMQAIHACSR